MRILFACSCLEPGKDGVGDYMRQLAKECAAQSGSEVRLAALNDSVSGAGGNGVEWEKAEVQEGIRTLRLSSSASWEQRAERLKEEIADFDPEAISFHFVPFALHPKGLAKRWPCLLGEAFKGRKLHWMFHELWIGAYQGAPFKERLLGALQRGGICQTVKLWNPVAIHTSNESYVALLNEAGIPATRLRMYGAIPPRDTSVDADAWFRDLMAGQGLNFNAVERDGYWFGLFFGTLHGNWPYEPLFGMLAESAKRQGRKVVILSLGYLRTGTELWDRMQKDYQDQFLFYRLGQKSPEEVGQLFAAVDFGLTSNPKNVLGKSSAAAAMMDHGLPVLINWGGNPLRLKKGREVPEGNDPLVWEADSCLDARLAGIDRSLRRYDSELPRAAGRVLEELKGRG